MPTLDDSALRNASNIRNDQEITRIKERSKSLPTRSKGGKSKVVKNKTKPEKVQSESSKNSKSSTLALQRVLENLEIRFTNCTFTFTPAHLVEAKGKKASLTETADHGAEIRRPRRSIFSRLKKGVSTTLESISHSVSNALECEDQFKACLFVPVTEEAKAKEFIGNLFSYPKITFHNCKFIMRRATVLEKVARKFRRVLGVIFELDYVTCQVTIEDCLFRIKDLPFVASYVQEEIADKA